MPYVNNISTQKVEHYGPLDANLLCVGESPGETEEREGKPFIGVSGQLLRATLLRHGMNPENVRYANLCNYRPLNDKFYYCYHDPRLQEGQEELKRYLSEHKPNVICALGKEAFKFFTGLDRSGVYRGSILPCLFDSSIKVITTYHPAYVSRNQDVLPTFDMDIGRVVSDSAFQDFRYPKREYHINPTGSDLERWVARLSQAEKLAVDIESVKDSSHIICVGFSPSADTGVTIFTDNPGSLSAISRILSSPAKKIYHFGIFDTLMLRWNGFDVEPPDFDTYIAQQTLYAGLPNGLDYLTSIYTREPYYKSEGRAEIPGDTKVWSQRTDREKLGIYNCKDVCVTFEIAEQQEKELETENVLPIFQFQMQALHLSTHISESGLLLDLERRNIIRRALYFHWQQLQTILDFFCKELVNVHSHKQLPRILYKDLGLPERKKRNNQGKWVVTTDEDALVATRGFIKGKIDEYKTAAKKEEWEKKGAVIDLILKIRGIRKILSSYIETDYSPDGRVRATYKVAGTDTGRWACSKFVDGTGVNAQTFYRDSVEVPDEIISGQDLAFSIESLMAQLSPEDKEEEENVEFAGGNGL